MKKSKFMLFSVDAPTKNSKLNLAKVSSLATAVELIDLELTDAFNPNLGLNDNFSVKFADEISKFCGDYQTIPETQTMIFNYDGFENLAYKSDEILNKVASDLGITRESAIYQAQEMFEENTVLVQSTGLEGTVYRMGFLAQSAGSAGLTAKTLAFAKLAGVEGLQILKAEPILAITLPVTGAIFFYGCGAIVGSNLLGKSLITTGNLLVIPMRGMEIMWNHYVNPVIHKVCGVPVILNMTQVLKKGSGYTVEEIARYIPMNKESIIKIIKDKVISWVSK